MIRYRIPDEGNDVRENPRHDAHNGDMDCCAESCAAYDVRMSAEPWPDGREIEVERGGTWTRYRVTVEYEPSYYAVEVPK